MYPPFPLSRRLVPEEGIILSGFYIPGGTEVNVRYPFVAQINNLQCFYLSMQRNILNHGYTQCIWILIWNVCFMCA